MVYYLKNIGLLLVAIVVALVLAEGVLRLVRPGYEYAAKSRAVENSSRIFVNKKNSSHDVKHPDTQLEHKIIYNSYGFRQQREFSVKKPEGVTRIGVFGDSFTENIGMPVHYSFTEPLDYLLNRAGKKVEVLNFGVSGYGTDQAFLSYIQDGVNLDLDYIVYMFAENDLRNILENNLFSLSDKGELITKQWQGVSKSKKFLRNFYLTYLWIDFSNRIKLSMHETQKSYQLKSKEYSTEKAYKEFNEKKSRDMFNNIAVMERFKKGKLDDKNVQKTLKLFLGIVNKMKNTASENGAAFCIATLPGKGGDVMHGILKNKGYESLNLNEHFKKFFKGSEFRFKKDYHWNEEGNKITAMLLFKFLAPKMQLSYEGDEFIEQAFYEYYGALGGDAVSDVFVKKHEGKTSTLEQELKNRYLSL